MVDEIIAPLFNTEWGRRAGWVVTICLLVLIFLLFILTLVNWHSDYKLAHTPPTVAEVAASKEDMAKLIAQLPQDHLFGSNESTGARLPVTSLQIRLVGIINSVPESHSRVIISEDGKAGKVYRVGDTLNSGVRVHSITPEGVVLENGGRLEKLPLQRSPLLFQGMPKALLHDENPQEE